MRIHLYSFLSAVFCGQVVNAQTTIDWWQPLEDSQGDISWVDNLSNSQATLDSLQITEGLLFPGFPQASFLDEMFWIDPLPVMEAGGVSALDVRVAPISGNASYSFDVTWDTSEDVYLLVGQLFTGVSGATSPLQISDLTVEAEIDYLGSFAWANSFDDFSEELVWDPITNSLSTLSTNDGDSAFALFRVSDGDGATFSIPSGFGVGTGDTISFAIGAAPVPEPSVCLYLFGALSLLVRRRS